MENGVSLSIYLRLAWRSIGREAIVGYKRIDLLKLRYTGVETRQAGNILISLVRKKLPWKSLFDVYQV